LQNERGYTVAESSPGIYTVNGDILPIQVIDSRRLPVEENLWLKNLSNELDYTAITQIGDEIKHLGKAARLEAYLHAVAWANLNSVKEAIKMDKTLTLDRVFEETGLAAKWEARARAEGKAEEAFGIAQNMVKLGLPFETVVSATRLDPEKVKALYQR
jgi:predicted transposase YdaD